MEQSLERIQYLILSKPWHACLICHLNHMCLNAACTCCGVWTPTCGGLLSPLAMALLFPFVCLLLFVCFLTTFVAVRIVLDLVAIAVTDLSSVFCIYIPG